MSLLLNTPMPLSQLNAQRLVPASLGGKNAHVLRVETPSAPETFHFLTRLYKGQHCTLLTVAVPLHAKALPDILDTAAQQIGASDGALAVIAVCAESGQNEAFLDGLSALLANRPETALVELLPFMAQPQITHFLTCADAYPR